MKHYYCTISSSDYICQCILLHNSIKKYDEDFELFVLCLDSETEGILDALGCKTIILDSVSNVEHEYDDLCYAKSARTMGEYALTLKAPYMLYIFKHYMPEQLIYMDADSVLMSEPDEIYAEWGSSPIFITEQYYSGEYKELGEDYGYYQAGFMGFMNNEYALTCLEWWKDKCIDWCFNKIEDGRWTDQKYMNTWPTLFSELKVSKNLGINATPFTLYRKYSEENLSVEKQADGLYFDDIKIISYHYYGFKYYNPNEADLCKYWMKFDEQEIENLYIPYIKEYENAITMISNVSTINLNKPLYKEYIGNYFYVTPAWASFNCFCTIANQNNIVNTLLLIDKINSYKTQDIIWVFCMDEIAYSNIIGLQLDNVRTMDISCLEDESLSKMKKQRSAEDYQRVIKSSVLFFILKNNYHIKTLYFVDPCLFFIDDPHISYLTGNHYILEFFKNTDSRKYNDFFSINTLNHMIVNRCKYIIKWLDDWLYYWKKKNPVNQDDIKSYDNNSFTLNKLRDSWIYISDKYLIINDITDLSDYSIKIRHRKMYDNYSQIIAVKIRCIDEIQNGSILFENKRYSIAINRFFKNSIAKLNKLFEQE